MLSSLLQICTTYTPSYVRTSLFAAKQLLSLEIIHKIHSGYKARAWEDPWILTTPTRHARPNAPVVYPRMTVSDFIRDESKELDVEILEYFVVPEGIH